MRRNVPKTKEQNAMRFDQMLCFNLEKNRKASVCFACMWTYKKEREMRRGRDAAM
jgi:hypothetical protein